MPKVFPPCCCPKRTSKHIPTLKMSDVKWTFALDTIPFALFFMLHCMTQMVIFALCDSSHFEADIWFLVWGLLCVMWTETWAFVFILGYFYQLFLGAGGGRYLFDFAWICILAHFILAHWIFRVRRKYLEYCRGLLGGKQKKLFKIWPESGLGNMLS